MIKLSKSFSVAISDGTAAWYSNKHIIAASLEELYSATMIYKYKLYTWLLWGGCSSRTHFGSQRDYTLEILELLLVVISVAIWLSGNGVW